MSVKRGRLDRIEKSEILAWLTQLPIDCDSETGTQAWGRTIALADRHKLTVYDATYLELALRLKLPLATLDQDLRHAAKAESLPLLGL